MLDRLLRMLQFRAKEVRVDRPGIVRGDPLQGLPEAIGDQTDLGSGIPGECYQLMKGAFEELDKTDPFDNHLTYRDVTQVLTFPSRKGNAMELFLIRGETTDLNAEIVQIIAIEKDGNGVKAIEPWELPYVVYF